jgi:hypothetical protein
MNGVTYPAKKNRVNSGIIVWLSNPGSNNDTKAMIARGVMTTTLALYATTIKKAVGERELGHRWSGRLRPLPQRKSGNGHIRSGCESEVIVTWSPIISMQ